MQPTLYAFCGTLVLYILPKSLQHLHKERGQVDTHLIPSCLLFECKLISAFSNSHPIICKKIQTFKACLRYVIMRRLMDWLQIEQNANENNNIISFFALKDVHGTYIIISSFQ